MNINLLVNCPNAKDATSLYRGIGPLGSLRHQMPNLNLNFVTEYSWATFKLNDVFFIQRPYSSQHLGMIQMAKDNGVKVWLDYDDDLFSVPISNPAYGVYSRDHVKKDIAMMINLADHVSVSTDFLKRQLQLGPQPLNKNITVIPNAFDDDLFGYRTPPSSPRRPLVFWRGSTTHQKDLFTHMEDIMEVVNTNSKWSFLFQGDKPWFLFEKLGGNAIFADPLDPTQYFRQIHESKPSVTMVPLHECDFNKSKSNIAWIEGAFFGSVTVAPDWEEWQRPGIIHYGKDRTFGEAMKLAMSNEIDPTRESEKAWEYIQDCLTLTKMNQKRAAIIESLL